MIYLDYAATLWPKPKEVMRAMFTLLIPSLRAGHIHQHSNIQHTHTLDWVLLLYT